jgi:signal transduction histidine kinase
MLKSFSGNDQRLRSTLADEDWWPSVRKVIVLTIFYFLITRLSWGLTREPIRQAAFFWPPTGFAAAAMIALGRPTRWLFVSGVAIANIIAHVTFINSSAGEIFTFAMGNVAEPLITAKLVEHHFGMNFSLGRTRDLLGLFAAAFAGIIVTVTWYAIAYKFLNPPEQSLTIWLDFFLGHVVGFVTIAPLVIGLFAALRDSPSGRELFEGVLGLIAVVLVTVIIAFLPPAHWDTVTPVALLLPILVWLAARCRPVFAAAAAFTLSMSIVWMTIFQLGHFGNASLSISDRVLQIQAIILVTALGGLILSTLFAERKETEARLARTNATLQRERDSKLMTLGAAIASISHEIKQPLAAVRANADAVQIFLAAKRPDLSEAKAAIGDVIQDNTRAADIIRNFGALFQRDEVEMLVVDLHQILYDVERILRADAASKGVTLQLDVPTALPPVMGNKTQLIEAVMNLVSNGVDSVCETGEAGRVEIRASQPEAGSVRVLVRDSGKGMEPEVMPRLFDAFFTTKPKGMGMGLAIVRSIIENHGGHLRATPNPDRGATFEFDLPVKASRY